MMNLDQILLKANTFYSEGDWRASSREYCRCLCVDPEHSLAAENLTISFWRLNIGYKLAMWCGFASRLQPNNIDLFTKLGRVLSNAGYFDQAGYYFKKVICINPSDALAWQQRASNDLNRSRGSESLSWISRSDQISQDDPDTHLIMAISLFNNYRKEEAKKIIKRLIKESPFRSDQYYHLARIYADEGLMDDAESEFCKAILLNPDDADYFLELSFCKFCQLDLSAAWFQFRHRLRRLYSNKALQLEERFPREKTYSGSDYNISKLAIWADEGIGDEIKYSSMLEDFGHRAEHLLVYTDKRLIPLYRRSFSTKMSFRDIDVAKPHDQYDAHIAIGSLGQYLRSSLQHFEDKGRKYLWADPERVAEMRALVNKRVDERIIGLSWWSSNTESGQARSLKLPDLVQMLQQPRVRFINLQYGNVDSDIAEAERDLGVSVWRCPGLDITEDLDGLAALIEACDEVVSIGNTTAHLAGALGKQTKVILTRSPNWRWLERSGRSLWYESVRITDVAGMGSLL